MDDAPIGRRDERPPPPKKGTRGLRRRRRRESALVWWCGFGALLVAAWWAGSWRLALLALLLWCLYQFVLVPTICRVMTRQGLPCREPARGRLFACGAAHQEVKNDAVWRLVGLRDPFRRRPAVDAPRETGVLVVSPEVRGRLAQADRSLIVLAALGTVVTVAGMVYGF
ncbi:hypothetical protein SMC26_09665 [Actinomadura fulvescens]|uniref:Uncharacterized protein n=1 Tax=Actinomadura fulvescens TaxID=46160 RepID=A0ABP6CHJ4_9ACTN